MSAQLGEESQDWEESLACPSWDEPTRDRNREKSEQTRVRTHLNDDATSCE